MTAMHAWVMAALDLVFPAICPACQGVLGSGRRDPLCRDCWEGIQRIEPPVCDGCGAPCGTVDPGGGGATSMDGNASPRQIAARCPACEGQILPFAYARAAAVYAGSVREAIHALKFGRRPSVARVLAALLLEQCGPGVPGDVDAVIAVPLAADRLAERGFNQAALIAGPVARGLRVPLRSHWLARVRATRPQSDLGAGERAANVEDAFRARPAASGSHVLLIDDVLTTGATAGACARALGAVGARRVGVLTVARALRGAV